MPHFVSPHLRRNIALLLWASCLIALSATSIALAAREPMSRCDICGHTLRGNFYRIGQRQVCANCLSRYPRCRVCGTPVRVSSYRSNGAAVCGDCGARNGQCGNCKDVLLGLYVQVKGSSLRFCKRCLDTKPHCGICDLPYPNLALLGDKRVCEGCSTRVHRCEACRQPIFGSSYKIAYLSGQFCQECVEKRPHCDFCGRPIVLTPRNFPDGRRSCATCNSTAIDTMEQALELFGVTVRYLQYELSMTSNVPFEFCLVDNNQMAAINHRQPGTGVKELGSYTSWAGSTGARRPVVAILTGLPRTAFLETAAHEYAHHWQLQRNPTLRDKPTVEGFAQWAASQWLIKNKLYTSNARLGSNPDPVYGNGYRTIKRRVDERGVPALLEQIGGAAAGLPPTAASAGIPSLVAQSAPARRLTGQVVAPSLDIAANVVLFQPSEYAPGAPKLK